MTARDEAIEAAAKAIGRYNEAQWERWRDGPTAQRHREIAAEALAGALPLLLNDLADRIEARRLTDDTGDPEDNGYNCAISDARAIVRAAAEGWGA